MKQRSITITVGNLTIDAILNDTEMANSIWDSLPISGSANVWGDEIYFSIPVDATEDSNASDLVSSGDIAFWPPGSAICLFFGETPISAPGDIRPASPTNIMGKINGDLDKLKSVSGGAELKVKKK